jgi:SAM-dependent methyltransferase
VPGVLAFFAAVVLIAALAYLWGALQRSWRDVVTLAWSVRPVSLACSLVLLVADLLIVPLLWRETLAECGVTPPRRRALALWLTTGLGRYLPGRAWPLLGQVIWGRADGLRIEVVWRSNVRLLLYATGAHLLAAALLLYEPPGPLVAGYLPARLVVAALGVACLHGGLWEWLDRRLGIRWTARAGPVHRRRITLLLALQWALFMGAVALALHGCWPGAPPRAATLVRATALVTGAFAAAQMVATAAVLVPGGLGVREGALAALLGLWFSPAVALSYGIASRLWLTAGEVIAALVGLAAVPGSSRREEPRGDAVWEARARLGDLRSVIDPADYLGGRNRFVHELHERALRPLLEIPPGAAALDVGSGNGRILALWERTGVRAFGADRSLALLRTSTCGRPRVCADIAALPFRDGAFAALSSVFVLAHVGAIEDPAVAARVARELRRVTAPGGRLLLLEKVRPDAPGPIPDQVWARAGWRLELARPVRRSPSWRSRVALVLGRFDAVRAALVRGEERTAGAGHPAYRDELHVLRAGGRPE